MRPSKGSIQLLIRSINYLFIHGWYSFMGKHSFIEKHSIKGDASLAYLALLSWLSIVSFFSKHVSFQCTRLFGLRGQNRLPICNFSNVLHNSTIYMVHQCGRSTSQSTCLYVLFRCDKAPIYDALKITIEFATRAR